MNLTGTWYNELGSSMELTVSGNNLSGTYQTAVGNASGVYSLVGMINNEGDNSEAIGFVVLWNNSYSNSDSLTAWSGQAQTIGTVDTIVATWLLTTETNPDDDWQSTLVGKDIFTRFEKSSQEIGEKKNKGVKDAFPASLKK